MIKVSDTWDIQVSGDYHELSVECTHDRDSYKKDTAGPYLYHTPGVWIVAHSNCDPAGGNNGYIRISSNAYDPEHITGIWEEKNNTMWIPNPGIKLTCLGKPSAPT